MRSTLALCLAYVASGYAYSVSSPNAAQGWTNSGPQLLVWTRVDTDPLNFTAVLVNDGSTISPQILAAQVDGTLGNTTLNPPSGGWPAVGGAYRVNLIANTTDSQILAQSNEFNITQANTTSSSSSSTGNATPAPGTTVMGNSAAGTNAGSATDTATTGFATMGSNGAVAVSAQAGLFGVALVAAYLV
ncbi:hypothetical protein BDP27DRAFT_1312712 [Rhodocollybia butyracea]|uniref:Yeast cell wall synthesis Kre9/Knh1-like N-terminal domain-containing protein n=1 Tax=Rhodocollybia butyracea TaxID=206335 RepID=A0A9P5UF38_9AGAR|nr:hypothetical protein BDP27DRAFT_1312712 [Rhodocollybia butyracea]